ncbi:MAG: serine/threonine protein kinase [Rhodopirellula sp.]|nr:serine/threonine protein kinase [Rhodopirellula sp.]
MSTVWRASDNQCGQTVALKAVHCGHSDKSARLQREFAYLSALSHSGIVTPYELHREACFWFFTMELVEGLDWLLHARFGPQIGGNAAESCDARPASASVLSRALTSREQFDRLRRTLIQLVDTLEYLHVQGIVHCDVKPSNVLVTPRERVVLIDFGLTCTAERRQPQSPSDVRRVGTIAYMAPELADFTEPSAAIDWYAIGVMLYEAMAGRPPYCGTFDEIMAAKQRGEPLDIRDTGHDVPEDLAGVCMNLLQADPKRRPSGEALRKALAH